MRLTEFLLARIAEDEAVARAGWTSGAGMPNLPQGWTDDPTEELVAYNVRFGPTRVLADCEAKRQIVEASQDDGSTAWTRPLRAPELAYSQGRWNALTEALYALALPYADHPDYDESWRP